MRFFVEWRFHRFSGYTTFKELWKNLNPIADKSNPDHIQAIRIVDQVAYNSRLQKLASLPDRAAIAYLNYQRFVKRNLWTLFESWFVSNSDAYKARNILANITDEYQTAVDYCLRSGGFSKFYRRMVDAKHKFFPSWKKAFVCLALSLFFLCLAVLTLGMLASMGTFGAAIAGLAVSQWFLLHSVTIFFASLSSISIALLGAMAFYSANVSKISIPKALLMGIGVIVLVGLTVASTGMLAGLGAFGATVAGLASTKWLLIHSMILAKLKIIAEILITPMTAFNFCSLASAFFIELVKPGYANIVDLGSRRSATINRQLTLTEMFFKILHFHRIVNKNYYVNPQSAADLDVNSSASKFEFLQYTYEFSLENTLRFIMNPIRWLEVPFYGLSLLLFRITDIGADRDTKSHFWVGPDKMFPSPRRISKEILNKFYEAAIIPALVLLNFVGDLPFTLGKLIIFDTIYSLVTAPPVKVTLADLPRPEGYTSKATASDDAIRPVSQLSVNSVGNNLSPADVTVSQTDVVEEGNPNGWENRERQDPTAPLLSSSRSSPLHQRVASSGPDKARTQSSPDLKDSRLVLS